MCDCEKIEKRIDRLELKLKLIEIAHSETRLMVKDFLKEEVVLGYEEIINAQSELVEK